MDSNNLKHVIFDTNAYRNFVSQKDKIKITADIEKLIFLERKNNIKSLASPIVLYELFYHLADTNDRAYNSCLDSIASFYLHNYENKKVRTIADPEDNLCNLFFGKKIPSRENAMHQIYEAAYDLGIVQSQETIKKHELLFKSIKTHVQSTEINYSNQIFSLIKKIDKNLKEWHLFKTDNVQRRKFLTYLNSDECSIDIGEATIKSIYLLLVEHKEEEFNPLYNFRPFAEKFATQFSPAVQLYKEVFRRLVNSEFDLTKNSRANFIWDYFIAQSLGQETNSTKIYLVTYDGAIITAAKTTGHNFVILTLKEYLKYLAFD